MPQYKTIGDRQYTKQGDQLIERAYPGKGDKDNRNNKKKFRDGYGNIWQPKCCRCRKESVSDADVYCSSCLRETMAEEEDCHKIF